MVYPMMVGVDFGAGAGIAKQPRGLLWALRGAGQVAGMTAKGKSAGLPHLAQAVMEPFFGGRHVIKVADEPPVSLKQHQAMSLGLILHELATNAAKYGALSVPDGQLDINWSLAFKEDGAPQIALSWREAGGPEVSPPTSDGFGMRLIRFSAERELDGRAELSFQPDGLIVTLIFPTQ